MTFVEGHQLTLHLSVEESSISSNKQLELKKATRFSNNNQIYDTLARSDYSAEEAKACWWTAKESTVRQKILMVMLEKTLANKSYSIVDVICAMQDSVRLIGPSQCDSSMIQNESHRECWNHFSQWTSYCKALRGLERYVASLAAHKYGTWSSYHRLDEASLTRDQVFRMQHEPSYTVDDIARRYQALSNPACLFAYFLAAGDAMLPSH
jgi:hypothetical protein